MPWWAASCAVCIGGLKMVGWRKTTTEMEAKQNKHNSGKRSCWLPLVLDPLQKHREQPSNTSAPHHQRWGSPGDRCSRFLAMRFSQKKTCRGAHSVHHWEKSGELGGLCSFHLPTQNARFGWSSQWQWCAGDFFPSFLASSSIPWFHFPSNFMNNHLR